MALRQCPKCGSQIAEQAPCCPHCGSQEGAPALKDASKKWKERQMIAAVAMLLGLLGWGLFPDVQERSASGMAAAISFPFFLYHSFMVWRHRR